MGSVLAIAAFAWSASTATSLVDDEQDEIMKAIRIRRVIDLRICVFYLN